jgi:ArsR family transcriptional regulator, arsenate/arsenite/antimonite-responsive transcriptional repressor
MKNEKMAAESAVSMFAALAQETRLQAYQYLVKAGPEGLPAGSLSELLAIPHNTLSFHLSHLSKAGVVDSRKEGRSIIYMANYKAVKNLIGFMVQDCCHADNASFRKGKNGCSVIELADCC